MSDARVMQLWRDCGLPEYFLGNGGTNTRLAALAERIRAEALEEAATTCLRKARDYVIPIGQDNYHDGCVSCAAAIRALKNKAEPQS